MSPSIKKVQARRVQKSRKSPSPSRRASKSPVKAGLCAQGGNKRTPIFACLYAKRYPSEIGYSCRSGWPNIARLKEHLRRRHKRPPFCPRCTTIFERQCNLQSHLRESKGCKVRAFKVDWDKLWLPEQEPANLRTRTKKGENPEAIWKELYTTMFDIDDPSTVPSPYVDDPESYRSLRDSAIDDVALRAINECRLRADTLSLLRLDDVVDIIKRAAEHVKNEEEGDMVPTEKTFEHDTSLSKKDKRQDSRKGPDVRPHNEPVMLPETLPQTTEANESSWYQLDTSTGACVASRRWLDEQLDPSLCRGRTTSQPDISFNYLTDDWESHFGFRWKTPVPFLEASSHWTLLSEPSTSSDLSNLLIPQSKELGNVSYWHPLEQ